MMVLVVGEGEGPLWLACPVYLCENVYCRPSCLWLVAGSSNEKSKVERYIAACLIEPNKLPKLLLGLRATAKDRKSADSEGHQSINTDERLQIDEDGGDFYYSRRKESKLSRFDAA